MSTGGQNASSKKLTALIPFGRAMSLGPTRKIVLCSGCWPYAEAALPNLIKPCPHDLQQEPPTAAVKAWRQVTKGIHRGRHPDHDRAAARLGQPVTISPDILATDLRAQPLFETVG